MSILFFFLKNYISNFCLAEENFELLVYLVAKLKLKNGCDKKILSLFASIRFFACLFESEAKIFICFLEILSTQSSLICAITFFLYEIEQYV